MSEIESITLPESFSEGKLRFLRVQFDPEMTTPFALVRYTRTRKEEELGLRLDFDKGIFLDHLESEKESEFCRRMVPAIIAFVRDSSYVITQHDRITVKIPVADSKLPQVWNRIGDATKSYLLRCANYLRENNSFTFSELASGEYDERELRAYHRNLFRAFKSERAIDPFVRWTDGGLIRYALTEGARQVILHLARDWQPRR